MGTGLPDDPCAVVLSTDPSRTETPVAGRAVTLSRLTVQPGEGVLLRLLDPAQEA